MHPAIPKAIGSFAAVSEMILTIDETLKNAGTLIAIKITATAIMIYIALLKIISDIARFLSSRVIAPNESVHAEILPFFALFVFDITGKFPLKHIWRQAP